MGATRKLVSVSMAGFIALIMMAGLLGFAQRAQAADYAAGSLATQATSSAKTVKGTIKSGATVTKTFKMPKKGYVKFSVSFPKGLLSTAVRIDCGDVRYVSTNVFNGNSGFGNGKYTSDKFSLKPGAKIKVTLELPGGILNQNLPYTIKMVNKTPQRYESESNNKKSVADVLKAGKTYSGNILKNGVDWFVFKAPKAGTYKFSGKMALSSSGTTTTATMDVFQGSKTLATANPVSGNGYENLTSVTLKKGAKIYVKVTPNALSINASSDYVLKVTKTK